MATGQQQAKLFMAQMGKEGKECYLLDESDDRIVYWGFSGDYIQKAIFYASFDEDGEAMLFQTHALAQVPTNRISQVLCCCNKLHEQYRWATFYIDSDNNLILQHDEELFNGEGADNCVDVAERLFSIADDAYPALMKAIWSE